jgi:hypothetical protein
MKLLKGVPPALLFGLLFFALYITQPQEANAHGGGLNKCGCHIDHRYNTCHCHQAPYGGCGPECYSRFAPDSPTLPEEGCAIEPKVGLDHRVVSYVESLALKEDENEHFDEVLNTTAGL